MEVARTSLRLGIWRNWPTSGTGLLLRLSPAISSSLPLFLIILSALFNDAVSCLFYRVGNRWMNEYGAVVEWYTGKAKYWEKNRSQFHFVHHKSHMNWNGMELGYPRWVAVCITALPQFVYLRNSKCFIAVPDLCGRHEVRQCLLACCRNIVQCHTKVNVTVNLSLKQVIKAQMGSRGIALLFL
jgi:hypothetical protein